MRVLLQQVNKEGNFNTQHKTDQKQIKRDRERTIKSRIIPFRLNASVKLTMFGCLNILKILTSRSVVFLSTSSSSDSLNFFIARISPDSLFRQRSTTPYAPSPTTPRTSYLFIIPSTFCFSVGMFCYIYFSVLILLLYCSCLILI